MNEISGGGSSASSRPEVGRQAVACDHHESLYGRCTACGMTWEQQAAARATECGFCDGGVYRGDECPYCGGSGSSSPADRPTEGGQGDV